MAKGLKITRKRLFVSVVLALFFVSFVTGHVILKANTIDPIKTVTPSPIDQDKDPELETKAPPVPYPAYTGSGTPRKPWSCTNRCWAASYSVARETLDGSRDSLPEA